MRLYYRQLFAKGRLQWLKWETGAGGALPLPLKQRITNARRCVLAHFCHKIVGFGNQVSYLELSIMALHAVQSRRNSADPLISESPGASMKLGFGVVRSPRSNYLRLHHPENNLKLSQNKNYSAFHATGSYRFMVYIFNRKRARNK